MAIHAKSDSAMPIRIKFSNARTTNKGETPKGKTIPEVSVARRSRERIVYAKIPPAPEIDKNEDRVLYEEQQTSRVEKVMMQGYRDPIQIARQMNMSAREIEEYMRRVQARWDIEGGQKKFMEYRGESLYRLRALEARLWQKLEELEAKTDSEGKPIPIPLSDLIAIQREIRETARQRGEMLGLTKERIDRLMDTEAEQALNFKRKADVFESGARVAAHILDIMEERLVANRREARSRIIENEPRIESP